MDKFIWRKISKRSFTASLPRKTCFITFDLFSLNKSNYKRGGENVKKKSREFIVVFLMLLMCFAASGTNAYAGWISHNMTPDIAAVASFDPWIGDIWGPSWNDLYAFGSVDNTTIAANKYGYKALFHFDGTNWAVEQTLPIDYDMWWDADPDFIIASYRDYEDLGYGFAITGFYLNKRMVPCELVISTDTHSIQVARLAFNIYISADCLYFQIIDLAFPFYPFPVFFNFLFFSLDSIFYFVL